MSQINVYRCPAGHDTITKDTPDRDVTPFQITCPECKANAFSLNYKVSQLLEPTHEWFIAKTTQELKEACLPLYGDVFSEEEYISMLDGKSTMYRKIKTTE